MQLLLTMMLFSMTISIMFIFMNLLFNKNKFKNKFMKMLPFECGGMPFMITPYGINLKYFKVILLFLIFDVEFALILPSSYIIMNYNNFVTSMLMFILYNFLMLTLYYELGWGILNWSK